MLQRHLHRSEANPYQRQLETLQTGRFAARFREIGRTTTHGKDSFQLATKIEGFVETDGS